MTEYLPELADGTLVIIVCRAKHLPNRRKLDKQSPYVTLRIGTSAERTSSHFRAGQTPEWTQEVRFKLSRDRKPILKLDVLDETKNDPTPIGSAEIDCSIVFANPQNGKYIYDNWYDLTLMGKRAGMVYLEMTFYPSAPIVPPKIQYTQPDPLEQDELHIEEEPWQGQLSLADDTETHDIYHPYKPNVVVTETKPSAFSGLSGIYSSMKHPDSRSDRSRSPEQKPAPVTRSAPRVDPHDVFVTEEPELHGTKKIASKFAKIKSKLTSKEPLTFWQNEGLQPGSPSKLFNFLQKLRSVSPISAYDGDVNNLDQLQKDILYHHNDVEYHVDEIIPPVPKHNTNHHGSNGSHGSHGRSQTSLGHSSASQHYNSQTSLGSQTSSNLYKPHPSLPGSLNGSQTSLPVPDRRAQEHMNFLQSPTKAFSHSRSPTRKPPPGSYSVPFSADTIGDDELIAPLNFGSSTITNPNEIDPKYYAPTPQEHQKLQTKLHVKQLGSKTDLRTHETGYLGNGKFSPNIFQRADKREFSENEEDKPQVPPKVPIGLTEGEYKVLDRESWSRDNNGRRF